MPKQPTRFIKPEHVTVEDYITKFKNMRSKRHDAVSNLHEIILSNEIFGLKRWTSSFKTLKTLLKFYIALEQDRIV